MPEAGKAIAELDPAEVAACLDRGESVTIQVGAASFTDAHHVRIQTESDDHTIPADAVIVATGSGPIFLPQVKPDMKRIIAPRAMGKFTELPKSIAVIGALAADKDAPLGSWRAQAVPNSAVSLLEGIQAAADWILRDARKG